MWSQAAGFIVLAIALPVLPGTPHATDFAWGALCGVIGSGAVGLLYRGLAVGAMGIVSPLTAVLAAILPVAYAALHNARPTSTAGAGIVVALVAVIAISAAPPASRAKARRGTPEAAAAGLLFGVFFIVLAQTRSDAGLYPLLGARIASFGVFAIAGTLLRTSIMPARTALVLIVSGGICDMLANVLYLIAAHNGALAIVVVLTALYPASTVALAAIVLHERLRLVQWAGVVFALAGVMLISAGR